MGGWSLKLLLRLISSQWNFPGGTGREENLQFEGENVALKLIT